MPVPGPRTQERPLPGYTNPDAEEPDRINHWRRPGPIQEAGRSPGTMTVSLRGNILAPGQVRRLWRQSIQYIAAGGAFSWTDSAPANRSGQPYMLTRALRYMTRSLYGRAGEDNTRLSMLHTYVHPRARSKTPTLSAGVVRNRPTVRNRLTSFGSRVPPLNSPSPSAQQ